MLPSYRRVACSEGKCKEWDLDGTHADELVILEKMVSSSLSFNFLKCDYSLLKEKTVIV